MRAEEEIVLKIKEFLNSNDQTNDPVHADIAERYAKMCVELNQRLDRCERDIDNNMRAEAIYFAESNPPVIRAAATLNFPELDDWREICQLYNWEEAPAIKMDKLDVLKAAYKENAALTPLLNEYRKKARRGELDEKIDILRRIRSLDPDNPNWEEDIHRFENQKLAELQDEAKKLIQTEPFTIEENELLKRIREQLVAADWSVTPPANVIKKIEDTLHAFRVENLKEKGALLRGKINSEYSNFNADGLNGRLKDWDDLTADPDFNPESSDVRQIDEARDWLRQQTDALNQKREFKNQLAAFNSYMEEKNPDLGELDRRYHALAEFDDTIPQQTTDRYHQFRETLTFLEKRKFIKKLVFTVIIFLVVIAGLAILIHWRAKVSVHDKWADPVKKALSEGKLDQAKQALEKIKELKPEIYQKPDVQTCERTLNEKLKRRDLNRSAFLDVVKRFDAAKARNFSGQEPLDQLIQRAESLAQSDEETLRVEDMKTAKAAHDNRTRVKADNAFLDRVAKLNEVYAELQRKTPEQHDLAEFKRSIADFEKDVSDLSAVKGVSKEIFTVNVNNFNAKVGELKRSYQDAAEVKEKRALAEKNRELQAQRKEKRKAKLLDDLASKVIPLAVYKRNLAEFVETFPDDPRVGKYKKILALMPAYEAAASLKSVLVSSVISQESIDECEQLRKVMDENPQMNIWRNDLKRYLDYHDKILCNHKAIVDYVNYLPVAPVMKFRKAVFSDDLGKRIDYYSINESTPVFGESDGKKLTGFKAMVIRDQNDQSPRETTFWKSPEGTWDVWEGDAQKRKGLKKVSAGDETRPIELLKVTRGFQIALTKVQAKAKSGGVELFDFEEFLLDKMAELKKNGRCNPFLTLEIMGKFFSFLNSLAINPRNDYRRQEELINDLMASGTFSQANWMSLDENLRGQLRKVIGEIPDMKSDFKRALVNFNALTAALGRMVTEVGVIRSAKNGKGVDLRRTGDFQELWILDKRPDQEPRFLIIGEIKNGKATLNPKSDAFTFDGQPVFAPMWRRDSRKLSEQLKAEADGVKIDWPKSWPFALK